MKIAKRHRATLERGALLSEVLLALSLVVAVVVLIAGVFPYSYTVDQKAWRKSSAQRLVGSTIEQIRGQAFEDIASSSATVMVEQVPFKVDVTVSDTTPHPVKSKTVHCTVSWNSPQGQESFAQETRVAKFYRTP